MCNFATPNHHTDGFLYSCLGINHSFVAQVHSANYKLQLRRCVHALSHSHAKLTSTLKNRMYDVAVRACHFKISSENNCIVFARLFLRVPATLWVENAHGTCCLSLRPFNCNPHPLVGPAPQNTLLAYWEWSKSLLTFWLQFDKSFPLHPFVKGISYTGDFVHIYIDFIKKKIQVATFLSVLISLYPKYSGMKSEE